MRDVSKKSNQISVSKDYYAKQIEELLCSVESITDKERSHLTSMLSDLDIKEALLVLKGVILEAQGRSKTMHKAIQS